MTHIRTFRGLIQDGGQDTIVLHTNNGSTGYQIKKFDVFPKNPGHTADKELLVTIWSVKQPTHAAGPGTIIDFSNQELLAVGYCTENTAGSVVYNPAAIIFDNMTFNQDIYVINQDQSTGEAANYYIELEQMSLDLNENTVATLKDIRNTVGTA
tara:strand:- start:33 stop:494 length:462 start_codon:yes stop_codon:yes gene_type:complete